MIIIIGYDLPYVLYIYRPSPYIFIYRPFPYNSAVSQDSRNSSRLATRPSDDDEAFALARILPFLCKCRDPAPARVAVQMLNEVRPGRWCDRGEGAPLNFCSKVSDSRGPLTAALSHRPGAARASWLLCLAGTKPATGRLSTPPERRLLPPQAGGFDHRLTYS